MPLDKKTLKAHLLERYTAHLDEMLAQLESDEQLHLTAIEETALELRANKWVKAPRKHWQ